MEHEPFSDPAIIRSTVARRVRRRWGVGLVGIEVMREEKERPVKVVIYPGQSVTGRPVGETAREWGGVIVLEAPIDPILGP
jgi:hypothetical protein